jgi:hypothetical protein
VKLPVTVMSMLAMIYLPSMPFVRGRSGSNSTERRRPARHRPASLNLVMRNDGRTSGVRSIMSG